MNMNRRHALKTLGAGAGLGLWPLEHASLLAAESAPPRRVVFFLQNHGFCPAHAVPEGITLRPRAQDQVEDIDLTEHRLPKWIDPLEPIKHRLTILQGTNGRHVDPYHGAPYGALGGYLKSKSTPRDQTIDCALGAVRPGVLPLLAFGWGTLERMRDNGIGYASSAWGPQIPAPLFCDPNLAFSNLFGVARQGLDRRLFEADTELFEFARQDADQLDRQLSGPERARFATYRDGLAMIAEQRRRLLEMTDRLAANAPAVTDRFTKPRFETDWWEASLEVATSALIAGVTNVITICSGFCESTGSWNGLSLSRQGHAMGHQNQEEAEDWLVLRRYNMHHLLQVVRALEAVPEGTGTMMDNTVIVYTSCHGESQHSKGDRWPFLLIGNLGGTIRSGRYISYPAYPHRLARSINALYLTLLHAFGDRRDHFNLAGPIASVDRHGPLDELLA